MRSAALLSCSVAARSALEACATAPPPAAAQSAPARRAPILPHLQAFALVGLVLLFAAASTEGEHQGLTKQMHLPSRAHSGPPAAGAAGRAARATTRLCPHHLQRARAAPPAPPAA